MTQPADTTPDTTDGTARDGAIDVVDDGPTTETHLDGTMAAHVADRVRELRTARRWSAQQLADRLATTAPNLTRGTIAKIESGVRKVLTIDEVGALADAFDLQLPDLLSPKTDVQTRRINCALLPDPAQANGRLLARTGLKQIDIINRAITIYEFIDAVVRNGEQVVVRHADDTETRIVLI